MKERVILEIDSDSKNYSLTTDFQARGFCGWPPAPSTDTGVLTSDSEQNIYRTEQNVRIFFDGQSAKLADSEIEFSCYENNQ
jgi:hypothetical protein